MKKKKTQVVILRATTAVQFGLCCGAPFTEHDPLIPLGHTSKQDVDLLMWYHLDSVTGLPQKILFLVEQWYSQLNDMSAMLWTSGDSY